MKVYRFMIKMYSRSFQNETFWDRFWVYHDIFAVCTWYVQRENESSILETSETYIQVTELRSFIMHKQALEKRRYLVRITVRYMHTYVSAAFFT